MPSEEVGVNVQSGRAVRAGGRLEAFQKLGHTIGVILGAQTLGGIEPGQFIGQPADGNNHPRKLTGSQLQPGEADMSCVAGSAQGREVVGAARIEQIVLGDRAGSDDTGHFTAHQPLGLRGILHLIADGGAISRLKKFL